MDILRSCVGIVFAILLLLSCASNHETRKCVFSSTAASPAWNEQKLEEALKSGIAEPLEMRDFNKDSVFYVTNKFLNMSESRSKKKDAISDRLSFI